MFHPLGRLLGYVEITLLLVPPIGLIFRSRTCWQGLLFGSLYCAIVMLALSMVHCQDWYNRLVVLPQGLTANQCDETVIPTLFVGWPLAGVYALFWVGVRAILKCCMG
jgi:hypothetical protein